MRILFATDLYPPSIGGVQRQVQLLAKLLSARGHQVNVVTIWNEDYPFRQNEDGLTVYRLRTVASHLPILHNEPKISHSPPFPEPAYIYGIRKIVSEFRPDVVHAYGSLTYSCAVALIGISVPLVVSARDYRYTCAMGTLVHQGSICDGPSPIKCLGCATKQYGIPKGIGAVAAINLGLPLLRHSMDAMHNISRYTQEVMRRDLMAGLSLFDEIIPSFRETREVQLPSSEFLEHLPSSPFILFVGALSLQKGLNVLLNAYEQLENQPPLVLIGTCQEDTPKTFPGNVTLITNVPHHEVMVAWEQALFGVVPSLWPEPFGSVVHEGMSKGKAVIGTTPGGHADMIIDEESGLLVPSGNVTLLVQAMESLISNAPLRERLGQAALLRSEMFTADTVVPQFEEFYYKVISQYEKTHISVVKV